MSKIWNLCNMQRPFLEFVGKPFAKYKYEDGIKSNATG